MRMRQPLRNFTSLHEPHRRHIDDCARGNSLIGGRRRGGSPGAPPQRPPRDRHRRRHTDAPKRPVAPVGIFAATNPTERRLSHETTETSRQDHGRKRVFSRFCPNRQELGRRSKPMRPKCPDIPRIVTFESLFSNFEARPTAACATGDDWRVFVGLGNCSRHTASICSVFLPFRDWSMLGRL